MAKIASKVLFWASVSDAELYNVRIVPDQDPFSYDIPPAVSVSHQGTPEHEADLAGTVLPEGVYDIFVTAQDAAGNESDPLEFQDAVLDFTPPAMPSSGGFR
jgi:hypothetical protein